MRRRSQRYLIGKLNKADRGKALARARGETLKAGAAADKARGQPVRNQVGGSSGSGLHRDAAGRALE